MTEYLVHGSPMVITNSCLDMPDGIIHLLQLADVLARFQRGKLFPNMSLTETEICAEDREHGHIQTLKRPPPSGRGLNN